MDKSSFLVITSKHTHIHRKKLNRATVIVPRCFDYFFRTVVLPVAARILNS